MRDVWLPHAHYVQVKNVRNIGLVGPNEHADSEFDLAHKEEL